MNQVQVVFKDGRAINHLVANVQADVRYLPDVVSIVHSGIVTVIPRENIQVVNYSPIEERNEDSSEESEGEETPAVDAAATTDETSKAD